MSLNIEKNPMKEKTENRSPNSNNVRFLAKNIRRKYPRKEPKRLSKKTAKLPLAIRSV
jgi:hypothetical protein